VEKHRNTCHIKFNQLVEPTKSVIYNLLIRKLAFHILYNIYRQLYQGNIWKKVIVNEISRVFEIGALS